MLPIVYVFYSDHAYEIREQAILCFEKICISQDDEWKQKVLWEKIKQQVNSDNYIFRINGMHTIDLLKNKFRREYFNNDILVYIVNLKYDSVANVKLYLCKVLKSLFTSHVISDIMIINQVKPSLEMLRNDSDVDVVYYSEECLNAINDPNNMTD